ncbi:DUF406 family protein [Parashewanella spongiae]|uniref:DUF406 family protein n=1 Tax=Parashewanella spongiae TaxID=342950 RepID=A0A3A6U2L9_9GAMM|nr:DUF406 family protein [Parashewanella spongiae]MCL1077545.1 YfcZ/YiiS family protein [Parashewanella spongiae]RJY18285.1 DUF406 family protein [Parashewanella spongiae]
MKEIKNSQSIDVNDTCNTCGAFVDLGAVINENDTELLIELTGADANSEAQRLATIATQNFTNVDYKLDEGVDKVSLVIKFNVTAEKMIFQMQQGLT